MNYPSYFFFRIKCKEFEVGKKVYAVIKLPTLWLAPTNNISLAPYEKSVGLFVFRPIADRRRL